VAAGWKSYDDAASAHERFRVPALFAAPARDLVARMDFASARRALDVGTGSGVIARTVGQAAAVVGVDPSIEMVRLARGLGVARVVAAGAPGLPFPAASFDRVTAGFVLSHTAAVGEALRDMVRVLRPGGLLGVTAWADRTCEHSAVWKAAIERFVDQEALRSVTLEALPSEEWLAREGNLTIALDTAGLRDIAVERIAYPSRWTIDSFLEMRDTSTAARFLRHTDPPAWERFRDAVAVEFRERFRDPIELSWTAWIEVGSAPV